ncbi:torsin-1A-like [Rhinoderma darwinii]|uniref:torsin-1A-like n=1 Tax=Rhinoderma darwinii TaxID=43563 RepID=UPI003F6771F5
MKLQDFYHFFTFLPSISYIQDQFLTQCDRMACHMNVMPEKCECCITEESINMTALQYDLDTKFFGQHLAKQVILKVVNNNKRIKPLVLSFHGLTGTGKTYINQILAKHFNPMGTKSKFVHKIMASFPHRSQIDTYKDQLHAWIRGNVSRCERSIFLFEDVHDIQPELLHSLKPYLDYHDHIDGVSYRKAIFIFTSNTGADKISDFALEFHRKGKKREEIQLLEVQKMLSSYLLNSSNSEFRNCDLIKKNVIDIFVPFLPLELEHVKMCVRAAYQRQGRTVDEEMVSKIAKEMDYYPKGEDVFSQNGCKNVQIRVELE